MAHTISLSRSPFLQIFHCFDSCTRLTEVFGRSIHLRLQTKTYARLNLFDIYTQNNLCLFYCFKQWVFCKFIIKLMEISTWVLYDGFLMDLSVWDPYRSYNNGRAHKGKPVYIAHWAHMGLLSGPLMGPLWACHMGLTVWDPYTYKPVYITHGAHMGLLSGESLLSHRPINHINYMVYRSVYIHRVFPLIDE